MILRRRYPQSIPLEEPPVYLPRPVAIRVLVILAVIAIAGASSVFGCAGLTGGSVCGMQTPFGWVPLP